MIRDMSEDYAVLQSGYWRVEVDTARPRLVSMRADAGGLGDYCPEMLEPGLGGESRLELADQVLRSCHSVDHRAEAEGVRRLHLRGITMRDIARLDWTLELAGDNGDLLRVTVGRELLSEITAITDTPFAFQCLREFAFWSRPSLRFNHDPTRDFSPGYPPTGERARRRVIGYHDAAELSQFVIHGSPSFPDLTQTVSRGQHHLEQHYTRHTTFGVSSRDFSPGPLVLVPSREGWTVELRPSEQGKLAPVDFHCGDRRVDSFVPAFFDGCLLSGIACDHEYFGNNPYRHAYAPGAIDHVARGYFVTDRRCWSDTQGDIEERWRNHIRRTLAEGRRGDGRLFILLDSGVWQDACGAVSSKYRVPALEANFATACCLQLLKSGDMKFAAQVMPDLEAMMWHLDGFDADGDGLLENPIPGTPGSPASSYNDNLCSGHKDGYLNVCAHTAFCQVGSLAQALGRSAPAAAFATRAQRISTAFNDQLWDEAGQHYVGWIDIEGTRHDAWYTLINLPAITTGIASAERARQIMRSFLRHPNHHRIFAAGVNLDPIPSGDCESSCGAFGLWLNGGVLLGPAAHELFARAVAMGGECAWEMLHDVIAQWEKDRLCGTPLFDWCRPGWGEHVPPRLVYTGKNAYTWIDGDARGAGTEPYLADGAAMLWALYAGMLGIRADFQGLHLEPHLPRALRDTQVGWRAMGRRLKLHYHGHGDRLDRLVVNASACPGGATIAWEEIPEGSSIEVFVA